ncbi:MAG: carbonic anhydrase family protein [Burkholderiales bacterium]|uniref:carbonic anhydrase n=1 Tax=Inhella sp. TaxID=1921806 RepID=UPI001AC0863B|nr:carbonic anhydrase family protein [Burkholderiales bacterium]
MRRVVSLLIALALVGLVSWPVRTQAQTQAPAKEVPELRQRLAERLAKPNAAEVQLQNARARALGLAGAKPAAKPAARPPVAWGYTGEGAPEHWGELAPENRLCAVGTRQSPIDLRDTLKVDLEPIQFDYRDGGFTVLDTGHTIQLTLPPGNGLTVRQRRYELQQVLFRRPAEERINGRGFDMGVHLIHRDARGRTAIVAVLLQQGEQDQPVVQKVWNHLPLEKLQPEQVPSGLNLADLLPHARGYFTFMGSLTTPPCSEDVLWMVMREPVTVSSQQLAVFTRLYPMNARPIQPAAGRIVKESF